MPNDLKTILVVGDAPRFVGYNIVCELLDAGYKVKAPNTYTHGVDDKLIGPLAQMDLMGGVSLVKDNDRFTEIEYDSGNERKLREMMFECHSVVYISSIFYYHCSEINSNIEGVVNSEALKLVANISRTCGVHQFFCGLIPTLYDDGDSFIDCGDGDCATFDDCRCENQVLDPGEEGVDCGGICDKGCSVDELPTPIDPAFPEDPGGDSDFPSFDEEEEEGSSWWIWVLVLIVAIALGVFIFMKYKAGGISLKRKPKTSFEQYKRQIAQRPAPARRPPVRRTSAPVRKPIGRAKLRSKDEDELDKSLKEAEKLLKGGK